MKIESDVMPNLASSYVRRWQVPGLCLALAAITFAAFGRILTYGFVDFDDNEYVFDNPVVARGLTLKGFVWAFTHVHSNNWHPLTWLSHMLDCQLYGLNPAGHHLTNLLLHAATVVLLFLVLRQMTGALWRSVFVAAVFAVHPLRVESVAWVAERKDLLSGLFFVLTISAYVRYARGAWSPARYGLVMLLFAMGLMSKPMLVTLPFVLLLLDYWPLQRPESAGKLMMEKLPLLALSAASCVATLLAQRKGIQSMESLSRLLPFANALASCAVYLGQMVWPAGLTALYPFPRHGLPPWEVPLALALLAGLSAAAVWWRRKQPWLLVGWVWYLVMLLPVMGLVQVGLQAHADRYTYLPQIGIYMAVTWWAAQWRVGRAAFAALMAGVIAVLMVCTWKQCAYWRNTESMWTRALAGTTDNYVACNNLGSILRQKGRLKEAVALCQQALEIRPDYLPAHVELGVAFRQMGRLDEAIAQYQRALEIRPDYAEAHNYIGVALRQKGEPNEAIVHFERALQIKPDYAEACNNLGNALLTEGRADEAIARYQQALQIKPGLAQAHRNLGNALRNKGRFEEAVFQLQQAWQLDPADSKIQNDLAWLLATSAEFSLRNGNKALDLARQANEAAGASNAAFLRTLAAACAETGRFPEAASTAQRALTLATTQSNTDLILSLKADLQLYQTGQPLHNPAPTH